MKGEKCSYCMPYLNDVLNIFKGEVSIDQLIKMRSGVEALGKVMKCGMDELTCLPLKRVQREIEKVQGGR